MALKGKLYSAYYNFLLNALLFYIQNVIGKQYPPKMLVNFLHYFGEEKGTAEHIRPLRSKVKNSRTSNERTMFGMFDKIIF